MMENMPDEDNAALAKRNVVQAAMQCRIDLFEWHRDVKKISTGKVELGGIAKAKG